MKRVLFLIKALRPGGAERLLADAARHLDFTRRSYEVAYLVSELGDLTEELTDRGLRVHCLEGARGMAWVGRLRSLVAERGIGLIHSHSPLPAAGARAGLARLRPRVAQVYTEHNVWGSYHPVTDWANMTTFHRTDHVFAVSEDVRQSISYPRLLGRLPMPRTETLIHGLDTAAPRGGGGTDLRTELGIPKDVPVIGTVAGFRAEKGHRHLLEAARQLRLSHPDVRFVLVGEGVLEGQLRDRVRALGLERTVAFAGYRPDAGRLFDAFDVFALPSIGEGLPIALLEAMAAGVAPVATSTGGIPEVIENGRHGRLVAPADPAAMAAAIGELLDDQALRERLSEGARQRAADFDIRAAAGRMEAVYDELMA